MKGVAYKGFFLVFATESAYEICVDASVMGCGTTLFMDTRKVRNTKRNGICERRKQGDAEMNAYRGRYK